MTSYELRIVATVPIIAWFNGERLFCNAPKGYTLEHVKGDGTATVIERGNKPINKPFTPPAMAPGDHLRITGHH